MNSRPNRNESQSHPGNSPDALSDPQRPSTRASGKPQRPRVSAPQPRPDDQAALCRRGIVTIPNPGQRAAVNRGPLTSAPLSLRSFIPPIAQQCATTRERGKAILPPRQHPDVASKNPLHQKTGRSQRNLQRAGKARPARRRHCNRRALIKAQKQMPLILCQPLGARFPAPNRLPDHASRSERVEATAGARKPAPSQSSFAIMEGRTGRCASTSSRQNLTADMMFASGAERG